MKEDSKSIIDDQVLSVELESGVEDYNYSAEQVEAFVIDDAESAAIARAYDFRMIPLLFFMYLFSALDRGNLGQFKSFFYKNMHQADPHNHRQREE